MQPRHGKRCAARTAADVEHPVSADRSPGARDQKDVGRAMEQPGERATCIGVASSRAAVSDRVEDWRGGKPPSGKNGTQAIPFPASSSIRVASSRWARLYWVRTHTT